MIRINLLGVPKPKKGKAAAVPGVAGEGPNAIIIGVIILLVVFAADAWYYVHLDNVHAADQQLYQKEVERNKQLATIKEAYDLLQKQVAVVQKQVDVIHELQNRQTGYPMDLLNTIGSTISNTDAVWLISMQDQGNTIALQGSALSSDAVASLIFNLQKTGFFKSVEFQNTFQDNSMKDVPGYAFSLVCNKNSEKTKS